MLVTGGMTFSTTSTSTVSLAQPSDYSVYDKATQVKKQYINVKEIALDEKELTIISYKKNASKPTIIHGSATSKYENKFNYAENITNYLNFGEGYQVFQNKGNMDLTLIGVGRYITFGE